MHDQSDTVAALQDHLALHRRAIELLDLQRAQFGAFTPAYVWRQFDDARSAVASIKGELRALGEAIDDRPGDTAAQPLPLAPRPGAAASQEPLSIYRWMVVE